MTQINTNSTSNWNKTKYAKTVSALLFTKSVAMTLANQELNSQMSDGTTIDRPTTWFLGIQQYSANNTVDYNNLDLGKESLTINDTPIVAFTLDTIDEENAGWNIRMNTMENVARLLKEYIDGKFFGQILNFDNTVTAVALSKTNAYDTVSSAVAWLINAWVDETKIALVVDAFGVDYLAQNAVNSTFALSDKTYTAGMTWRSVAGAELVRSENLTMVGSFTLGVNPTANDTVTINGVTFKFVTSPAVAGDVDIGADAAGSAANLNAAINKWAGAGTAYVDFSAKVRNKFLRGFSSTVSSGTITFTSTRGYRGTAAFGKAMTSASNKFGQFVTYYGVMEMGAIHLVLRDLVRTVSGRIPWSLTYEYLTWNRFGLKVFEDGAERGLILPVICRAAE